MHLRSVLNESTLWLATESNTPILDVEPVRGIVQHVHKTGGKIVLKGIVSQNQSALFRKTNNLTKRGIMSASSISADPPAAPDIVSCSVLQGLLELVRETAVGCLCLGDFSPHDNAFRNASARASMSLHPTGS